MSAERRDRKTLSRISDPFFEGNPEKNWHKGRIAGHKELVMPVKLFEGGIGPGAEPAHAEIIFDIVLEKA